MSSGDRTVAQGGTVRVRRALVVAGCGVLTVSASACESTEQESAKIGREGQQLVASQGTLALGALNRGVQVSDATLLSRGSRTAVAVRLLNTSAHPQTEVPLLVDVVGKDGKTLYTNATGGLEPSLQRIGVLEPGRQEWWVNDQVLTSQPAASVTVRAGTGGRGTTTGAVDAVGVSLSQQSGLPVLGGGLVNHAGASASKVPVYAVGLRGGRIVAGGRAVVETVPGHSSTPVPFQIFLVGDPTGASFQVTVAPAAG